MYRVHHVLDHIEIFDQYGVFVCSADTMQEARAFMEEMHEF